MKAHPVGITTFPGAGRSLEGGSGILKVTVERVGLDQHRSLRRCEMPRCWDWVEFRYELPTGASDLLCRGHFIALLGDVVVDSLETSRDGMEHTLGNGARKAEGA